MGWTNWKPKGWCVIIIFENIDINIKQTQSNKKSFFFISTQKKTERSKLAGKQNIKPNKKTAQCNEIHFFAWKIADIQNMFKFKNENQIKTMNAKCENVCCRNRWLSVVDEKLKKRKKSTAKLCELLRILFTMSMYNGIITHSTARQKKEEKWMNDGKKTELNEKSVHCRGRRSMHQCLKLPCRCENRACKYIA